MFFGGPTIGTNGFWMVFKILRAMANNGFEVNDGLDDFAQREPHSEMNIIQSIFRSQNVMNAMANGFKARALCFCACTA